MANPRGDHDPEQVRKTFDSTFADADRQLAENHAAADARANTTRSEVQAQNDRDRAAPTYTPIRKG